MTECHSVVRCNTWIVPTQDGTESVLTVSTLSATIVAVNQDSRKEAQIMAQYHTFSIAGLRLWFAR